MGTFPYFSGKIAAAGMARGRCIAHMFAMRVAEELPTWPEGSTRQRVWVRMRPSCCVAHVCPRFEMRGTRRPGYWAACCKASDAHAVC